MKKNIFKKKMIVDCRLKIENFHSGQVAIIVMLVSALLITVGLSLSRKTTVETKIDYNEEALKKAFNAAESGIDYYLATGTTEYQSGDKLSQANVVREYIGGIGDTLNFGELTLANGVEYYWLVNHDVNGSLGTGYYNGSITIYHGWPVTDDSTLGSLEINIFYKNGSSFAVKRYGYNFSGDPNRRVTNFDNLSSNPNLSSVTINSLPTNPILMTITPIFSSAKLVIEGDANFPVQGERIISTGSAGVVFNDTNTNEETKINKRLTIDRKYKFPYFLLSGIVSETSVLSQ